MFVAAEDARLALRRALVLEHLDDRLHLRTKFGVLRGERRPVLVDRIEHQALAEVRVVRNREHVAAGQALEAIGAQSAPQALRRRHGVERNHPRRHRFVSKKHVAVNVASLRVAAPLVAVERGELAPTVGLVRLRLNVRPHARTLFGAISAKHRVADRGRARRVEVGQG